MLHEIITIKIIAFKINKDCVAIREYCASKIVFGPGKLSGVSRNGPQDTDNHTSNNIAQEHNSYL